MSNKEPARADGLQGTLDIMILQTLATLGPRTDTPSRRASKTVTIMQALLSESE